MSNIGGPLYVYPNNPAGMSVLVDPAFNLPQIGQTSPFLLNGAAAPVPLTLVTPVSQSYYATIYWDQETNAPGVVYGASSGSQVAILPDKLDQIPLALVLISSTQTSIQGSDISGDVRQAIFQGKTLTKNFGTVAANQTLNCNGANAVSLFLSITTPVNITLTLSALRVGVPVWIRFDNGSGSPATFKIAATTPGGVAFGVFGKSTGAAFNFTTTGFSVLANTTYLLQGNSYINITPTLNFMLL